MTGRDPSSRLVQELRSVALGSFSEIQSAVYRTRAQGNDLTLAKELTRQEPSEDALEQFRRLLSSGQFEAAKGLLDEQMAGRAPHLLDPEWLLEAARYHVHVGHYAEAERMASAVVEHSSHSPSRISASIVKANALFEMGQLNLAQEACRTAFGLIRIYPGHPGKIYAETLAIKIEARLQGVGTATRKFHQLLGVSAHDGPLNLDTLHVMIRVLNDLQNLESQPQQGLAMASVQIAERIGDDLYRGLDLVNLLASVAKPQCGQILSSLGPLADRYPRVKILLAEALGQRECRSTTGNLLARNFVRQADHEDQTLNFDPVTGIVSLAQGWFLNLQTGGLIPLQKYQQILQILSHFRHQSVVKRQTLFESLWPGLEYNKLDHDGLIRNSLSRIRKICGLDLKYQNGEVHLVSRVAIF